MAHAIASVLLQFYRVASENLLTLAALPFLGMGLGALLCMLLQRNCDFQKGVQSSIIFSGGIGLLIPVCFIVIVVSNQWPAIFPYLVILLFGISLLSTIIYIIRVLYCRKFEISAATLLLFLIFVCLFIVRISFLYGLKLPLYHDSAVHYQIIQDLQNPSELPQSFYTLEKLFSFHYYHFGFHSFIAVISAFSDKQGTIDNLMIIGQLLLVIFPFTVAFLVRTYTKDHWIAVFTAAFAGFGWKMPAYAMNWGKYPALACLAFFPLAITWLTIAISEQGSKRKLSAFLAGICCIASILLHSRATVFFIGVIVTYFFMRNLSRLSASRLTIIIITLIEIILLAFLFTYNQVLHSALNIYIENIDLLVTSMAILLIYFAVVSYTNLSLAILTFTVIISLFTSIPVPGFLSSYLGNYLLDRPIIQIVIIVPMALLAGIGMRCAIQKAASFLSRKGKFFERGLYILLVGFFFLLIFSHARQGDYQPDACCNFVKEDDLFTLAWVAQNLPEDSQVAVATQAYTNTNLATDAGIWLLPLDGIRTVGYPYITDFADAVTYSNLCSQHIMYVYRGSTAMSFDTTALETQHDWYSSLLSLPTVRLYQVKCQNK
jgi:hypothetical protein